MDKKIITTEKAPMAIGPYSIGVQVGDIIYTAGQLGLDPETNELVPGGVGPETEQAITNIKNILQAAGSGLENIIKTTVFLRDIGDFSEMNNVYAKYFTEKYPARSTVQVGALPKAAAVEIEAIAILS
jgi:2-iminobutanoate/2-iminopropanoate deaminase